MGGFLRVQHLRCERNNRSPSRASQPLLRHGFQRSRYTASSCCRPSDNRTDSRLRLRNNWLDEARIRTIYHTRTNERSQHRLVEILYNISNLSERRTIYRSWEAIECGVISRAEPNATAAGLSRSLFLYKTRWHRLCGYVLLYKKENLAYLMLRRSPFELINSVSSEN